MIPNTMIHITLGQQSGKGFHCHGVIVVDFVKPTRASWSHAVSQHTSEVTVQIVIFTPFVQTSIIDLALLFLICVITVPFESPLLWNKNRPQFILDTTQQNFSYTIHVMCIENRNESCCKICQNAPGVVTRGDTNLLAWQISVFILS